MDTLNISEIKCSPWPSGLPCRRAFVWHSGESTTFARSSDGVVWIFCEATRGWLKTICSDVGVRKALPSRPRHYASPTKVGEVFSVHSTHFVETVLQEWVIILPKSTSRTSAIRKRVSRVGFRWSCSTRLIIDCERPERCATTFMESFCFSRSSRSRRITREITASRKRSFDTLYSYPTKELTVDMTIVISETCFYDDLVLILTRMAR